MTTTHSRLWVAGCAAALLLTGCAGSDDPQPVSTAVEAEADDSSVQVADRALDAAVFYGGLEYRFGSMTVTDLDAEASPDGPVENRRLGVELSFEVEVHNEDAETHMPNVPVTLRWDETDTDNVVEVTGRPEFRQVPGGASASGEIAVTILPADLALYDDESARLVLGHGQEAMAQVPVGSAAALITRAPVEQPHLAGESFEAGPVTLTIDRADVRWNLATNQVADGDALLELNFTVENTSGDQACFNRGQGKTMSLVDAGGAGFVDLGLDERCFAGGSTVENTTGFTINDDYPGDYTLSIREVRIMADEFAGELPVSLVSADD